MVALLLLTVAAAAVWYALASRSGRGAAALRRAVRTATVRRGTVERTLRVSGTITSRNSAFLLAPRLPGRGRRGGSEFALVLDQLAPAGSRVRKGEVVASFDTLHMMNRLDDYRAQVVQHQALIKRLRAQLDVKRAQHNQRIVAAKARLDQALLDLKTAPVRSAIQVERFRLNRDEAGAHYQELLKQAALLEISENAAIRRYELMLREAELEMRRAEANAARMDVRAPVDGLVVLQSIRRGGDTGQVQAGDQLHPGQAFIQIVDISSTVLDAAVNQADIQQIRVGARARVHLDAYPEVMLPARVITAGGFARPQGWRQAYVRTLPLRLEVEGTDPRLLPDLSASADVILETAPEGPVAPLAYIESEGGREFVYVRGQGERYARQPVTVTMVNHVHAALGSGVAAGTVLGYPEDVRALHAAQTR